MVAARIAIAIAIARRPSMTTSSRCRLLTAYYDQLTLCWCWWRITRIGGAGSSWCWWVRVIMIIMQIVKVEKHHPHILVLAFTFLQLLSQDFCSGIVLWQQGVVLWEGGSCSGMLRHAACPDLPSPWRPTKTIVMAMAGRMALSTMVLPYR